MRGKDGARIQIRENIIIDFSKYGTYKVQIGHDYRSNYFYSLDVILYPDHGDVRTFTVKTYDYNSDLEAKYPISKYTKELEDLEKLGRKLNKKKGSPNTIYQLLNTAFIDKGLIKDDVVVRDDKVDDALEKIHYRRTELSASIEKMKKDRQEELVSLKEERLRDKDKFIKKLNNALGVKTLDWDNE